MRLRTLPVRWLLVLSGVAAATAVAATLAPGGSCGTAHGQTGFSGAAFFALGLFTAVLGAAALTLTRRQTASIRQRAEQLEKENLLAQFQALQSQVNPHFLFNSLSILAALVRRDPERSERFIDQLSRAYRYMLEKHDGAAVRLETELEFLNCYTFLLETRFENKLAVEIDIDRATTVRARVLPLTLQWLVENAVKHTRMSTREPLHIRIGLDGGQYLTVTNPLRPRGEAPGAMGFGLGHLARRYALLSDRALRYGVEGGDFVVRVPLLELCSL